MPIAKRIHIKKPKSTSVKKWTHKTSLVIPQITESEMAINPNLLLWINTATASDMLTSECPDGIEFESGILTLESSSADKNSGFITNGRSLEIIGFKIKCPVKNEIKTVMPA